MTRIVIALLLLPILLVPAAAAAAKAGLDSIEITPVQSPEDPDALVEMLARRPGFASVAWDADRGCFVIAVEESLSVDTRLLREELTAKGIEPERMELHLETINAVVDRNPQSSTAYLFAPANGIRLAVRSTLHTRRFWGFWGQNPRGQDADFRMKLVVLPGAVAENGVAAPDTADIIHFELTKPAYATKKPR